MNPEGQGHVAKIINEEIFCKVGGWFKRIDKRLLKMSVGLSIILLALWGGALVLYLCPSLTYKSYFYFPTIMTSGLIFIIGLITTLCGFVSWLFDENRKN